MSKSRIPDLIGKIEGGLIVSCQAASESPLNRPSIIAALATAAACQGAVGVRIDGAPNIKAVRSALKTTVVGIEKLRTESSPVYITPTLQSARRVIRAGADIVALDCTARPRPNGELLPEIITAVKKAGTVFIMADVATAEDGVAAQEMGVDVVATTLCGYTPETKACTGPAFSLLRELTRKLSIPVILEGHVRTPDDVRKAFDFGAHAVVVGTAITNVEWLVQTFVAAAPRAHTWGAGLPQKNRRKKGRAQPGRGAVHVR
jgi:N-acylglucosamine-6-phosphate 2-epimerase